MFQSNLFKIVSNYTSKLWSLFSVFLFIPIYIKYLGIENYAIIGFYSLVLGVIGFIDSGMSSAVLKEFSLDQTNSYKYSILHIVEKVYFVICLMLVFGFFLFSGFISEHWFVKTTSFHDGELEYYILLIGIGVTLQLLSSLYFGAYFGLNEQVKANFYQIIWGVSKSLFVVILFIFYKASLEVYFLWQIFCNILYILLLRFSIFKLLRKSGEQLIKVIKSLPKKNKTYILNVTYVAILTSLNGYADKIIASKVFNLDFFGFYNVASIIAQMPVYIASPLVLFIFPVLSKFFQNNKRKQLNLVVGKIYFLLLIVILPICFSILFFTKDLVLLWTGSSIKLSVIENNVQLIRLLLGGYFFAAMQLPLYYLLLSSDKTKISVFVSLFQLVVGGPILFFSAVHYGPKAIGLVWLIINFISFITIFCFIVNDRILVINKDKKIFNVLLSTVVVNFLVFYAFFELYKVVNINVVFLICGGGLISFVVNIFLNNLIMSNKKFNTLDFYKFPS